jgi:hypothetical protein
LANHPKKKISHELLSKYEQDFKEGKPDTFNNLIELLRDNTESDYGYIQAILEELQPKEICSTKEKVDLVIKSSCAYIYS